MSDRFIGIDVGGTKIATACLQDGRLGESSLQYTECESQDRLVEQLVAAIQSQGDGARAVGIGVPEAGLEPLVPRITMTLPCLNAARRVVFLVTGESKTGAVRRAFGDPPDPAAPGAHVRPPAGELTVLVDRAAAP